MTKDELIAETAMRIFSNEIGKFKETTNQAVSQAVRQVAENSWHVAKIFADAKPESVGNSRDPIKPI